MPHRLSAATAANEIAGGRLSPMELVDACLGAIDRSATTLPAFVTVLGERARRRARQRGDEIARGRRRGPLDGIPYAVKDNIAVAGIPTGAGCRAVDGLVPTVDATAVRTLDAAGGVLIGKTRLFELALASSEADVDPGFVAPTNPWDPERTAGGSSNGSAAAVAAQLVPLAIGTDTGGSVRIPAAFCGVVGMKPTQGIIDRSGILPVSWSLDTPGVVTRTVADNVLGVSALTNGRIRLAGPLDLASLSVAVASWEQEVDHRFDPRVRQAVETAATALAARGATTTSVTLPPLGRAQRALSAIVSYEGYRSNAVLYEHMPDRFGAYVRQRLREGATLDEDCYRWARAVQKEVQDGIAEVLDTADVLILPTVPFPAPRLAEVRRFGSRAHACFTRPFNLVGAPALSLPGPWRTGQPPVGIQVVARADADATVYGVASVLEKALARPGSPPDWTPSLP